MSNSKTHVWRMHAIVFLSPAFLFHIVGLIETHVSMYVFFSIIDGQLECNPIRQGRC